MISKRIMKSVSNVAGAKYNLFNFDIFAIIQKRIENYEYLLSLLKEKAPFYKIVILRGKLGKTVPQSFPVLLQNNKLRDRLYFRMNKEGYGVTSLYHELIEEAGSFFKIEHEISGRILNLPVHQDADKKYMGDMVKRMFKIISDYFSKQEK